MDPEPYLVLVVDDDSTIREITAALLENNGFKCGTSLQWSRGVEFV
jgi:CheY-like chemotaxis protein